MSRSYPEAKGHSTRIDETHERGSGEQQAFLCHSAKGRAGVGAHRGEAGFADEAKR